MRRKSKKNYLPIIILISIPLFVLSFFIPDFRTKFELFTSHAAYLGTFLDYDASSGLIVNDISYFGIYDYQVIKDQKAEAINQNTLYFDVPYQAGKVNVCLYFQSAEINTQSSQFDYPEQSISFSYPQYFGVRGFCFMKPIVCQGDQEQYFLAFHNGNTPDNPFGEALDGYYTIDMNKATEKVERLPIETDDIAENHLSVSPDGQYIALINDRNLKVYNRDNHELKTLLFAQELADQLSKNDLKDFITCWPKESMLNLMYVIADENEIYDDMIQMSYDAENGTLVSSRKIENVVVSQDKRGAMVLGSSVSFTDFVSLETDILDITAATFERSGSDFFVSPDKSNIVVGADLSSENYPVVLIDRVHKTTQYYATRFHQSPFNDNQILCLGFISDNQLVISHGRPNDYCRFYQIEEASLFNSSE